MAQWFYRDQPGRDVGPVTSSQLLELVRQGEIDSDTEVRKDESPWARACEVNGLWLAAGMPTVFFRCPSCDAEIERPPTHCKSCHADIRKATGQLVQHSRPKDKLSKWTNVERNACKPKAPPLQ